MELLFLLIPLLGIFALNLPGHRTAAKFAPWLLGAVCVIQAAMAATFGLQFWKPVSDALQRVVALPLTLDYISATVLVVIALVAAVTNAVGAKTGGAQRRVNARSVTLMLMIGMNGVVMVRDLFTLYIFLEITAVSSFILIAIEKNLKALEGAFKYLILSGIATFAMLVAGALIFMQTGSLQFADVARALQSGGGLPIQLALGLYVVAFCLKSGAAPFHGWLPDAYANAPDAVSVLLAGVVTKVAGIYGILRLMRDIFAGLPAPGEAFMILGAFSIAVGAFAAIRQTDMKRMLAFSSISQMGYIILAAGLVGLTGADGPAGMLAILGALLHFVNHALFKSLLFVDSAAVREQTGTTDMERLGGLCERMKVTGWTSVVGFLSTAGIPPFSGFWSKLLIIMALAAAGQWVFAAIAVFMSLVTLGYFLVMQQRVFFGKLRQGFEKLREARGTLRNTALVLAGLTTALGLLFPLALVLLRNYGLI